MNNIQILSSLLAVILLIVYFSGKKQPKYRKINPNDRWGGSDDDYYDHLNS